MSSARMASALPATIAPMVAHIKSNLLRHRVVPTKEPPPPLFVALQGPQGSGKTYLTSQLRAVLGAPPHELSVAVLSIDDLYLPHSGLVNVAAAYPNNVLLSGRGQPGTHDVTLGLKLLKELKAINDRNRTGVSVQFPAFEKSLFDGQGDRVEGGVSVLPPLDVVILEGWCVGFCPIDEKEVEIRFEQAVPDLQGILDLKSFKKENVLEINSSLYDYLEWWSFFDSFIQIKPPDSFPYSFIYKWRLQQEHNMKAKNGGKGMTDDQVKEFVDRYIPGYIFFSEGIEQGYLDKAGIRKHPKWKGSGLKLTIDESRQLLSIDSF